MKNKIFILLKTTFLNSFKIRNSSNKKKILMGVLAFYIIAVLMFTFGGILSELFNTLNEAGLASSFLGILFTFASFFSFVFTIYSAKAALFENKDNDLLFSLPIDKKTILLSRLLYITIYNLVIGLIFLIPGLYIYFINVAVTPIYYVAIFFMVIFFPVIPTILASLIGYLVAYLTSKTKRKNIFELLYYIIFIVIYMLFVTNSNKLLSKLVGNVELLNKLTIYLNYPQYLINKGIAANNYLYIIFFVLFNLFCLFLFIYILSGSYFKIISKLNSQKVKSNFKMKKIIAKNARKALVEKELKRYFSSAIYVFNTAFGVVFLAIAGVLSIFYSSDKLLAIAGLTEEVGISSFFIVFSAILFVLSFTETTNSSISIERNNFWIIKSIPVKIKDIFFAKKFVNKIILLPIAFVSLVLFAVNGYITYVEMILLLIIVFFYNDFISNFGLLVNLRFPKLDYQNDTVVVKQSMSSMIGIMAPMILGVLLISVLSEVGSNINILCITIAISVFLSILTTIILNKWGRERFYKIN